MTGKSSSAGRGPPHWSAASGASGVIHLNVTWLRSRKRRSSAQDASQRCPSTIARGGGGSAAMPCNPLIRSRAKAPSLTPTSGEEAAIAWYSLASIRMTRDGSAARKPNGNVVASAIGTSPKSSPTPRPPTTRGIPSSSATVSRRPSRTANRARPSPGCTAYSPGTSLISAANRERRSHSTGARSAKIETPAISSAVTTCEFHQAEHDVAHPPRLGTMPDPGKLPGRQEEVRGGTMRFPHAQSGCGDSNSGPLRPERSALPGCATPRAGKG